MDTTGLWEDDRNSNSAFHDNNTFRTRMVSEDKFKITNIRSFIVTCALCAIAIIILVFTFCCIANRCRNSGKTHRRRSRSEICEVYQNPKTIRDRLAKDSLETFVNRPLPHPPEKNRQPAGVPEVPEDDYLRPITVDAFWLRSREEILNLPPKLPIFPGHLERLPLDGEGAYTPVIADDEAPLLSPGPMHEITLNQELCEISEESDYIVPNSPTLISPQQNVTETDHSSEPRKIKRKGSEYQMVARAVVTANEAEKQCPNTSKKRSLSESATVNSATQDETGKSKDTKGKIYRSTCQLYLSPPTQPRSQQPSTSTATVVVYINTKT